MIQDSLDALRKHAKEALSRGKYLEARQIYEEGLAYYRDSPELHYGMATVCFMLEDLANAAHHFKEMIRLNPGQALAHINLGAVYNRMGQYQDSIATLRRGIQLDSTRAEGYYNLALAYKHVAELDLALVAYREALRLNPRMYEAHFNMGNIYCERKQSPQALAQYQKALEIRPDCEKAQTALDTLRMEMAATSSPPVVNSAPAVATTPRPKLDPSRQIDPMQHSQELREVHHVVVDLDGSGQTLLDVLKNQVEQAIRDVSISILTPNDPQHALDEQLRKFDESVVHLQAAQQDLQKRILRAKEVAEAILSK